MPSKVRGGARHATPPPSVLRRWKERSAKRVESLKRSLETPAATSAKRRARREWLDQMNRMMDSRREWLETRLEHANALQQVFRDAASRLDEAESADDGDSAKKAPAAAGGSRKKRSTAKTTRRKKAKRAT